MFLFVLIFFAGILDLLFFQWLFDALFKQDLSWDGIQIGKYILSLFWSACFWFLLGHFLKDRGPKMAVLVGLGFAAVFGISFGFKTEFFHLPNINTFLFTLQEPLNSLILIKDKVFHWSSVLFLILCLFFVFYAFQLQKSMRLYAKSKGSRFRKSAFIIAVVGLLASSGYSLGWHRFSYPLSFDTNFARIFFQQVLMWGGNKSNLRHPTRLEVAKTDAPNYNVILLINESLRADALVPGLDFTEPLEAHLNAPFFQKWSLDSNFIVFPNAYANSNTTNVSIPSILTGLLPQRSSTEFHTFPLFWDYAKKGGAQTFLFTSQDWTWEHFNDFFFSKNLDKIVHRRTHDELPMVNDLGVDDAYTLNAFKKHFQTLNTDKAFAGVIQFNNTHPPFYGGKESLALDAFSLGRYKKAVNHLDSIQNELFQFVKEIRSPRPTVLLFTADHGENLKSRAIGRHNNFHEEMVRVPMGVFLVKGEGQDSTTFATLRQRFLKNRKTPVQNVDLLPTALKLWGQEPVRNIDGISLTQDLPKDRILTGMGTCEIRKWSPEGFYLRQGAFKMVVSQPHPANLYHLLSDPGEKQPILERDLDVVKEFRKVLENTDALQKLCKRIGPELCKL